MYFLLHSGRLNNANTGLGSVGRTVRGDPVLGFEPDFWDDLTFGTAALAGIVVVLWIARDCRARSPSPANGDLYQSLQWLGGAAQNRHPRLYLGQLAVSVLRLMRGTGIMQALGHALGGSFDTASPVAKLAGGCVCHRTRFHGVAANAGEGAKV